MPQRTSNGKGVTIPSQMRYVHYYERIKAEGCVRPNKNFRLLKVRLITTPNFDVGGGCDPYFHIKMHADDSWSTEGHMVFGDKKTGGKKIFDCTQQSTPHTSSQPQRNSHGMRAGQFSP